MRSPLRNKGKCMSSVEVDYPSRLSADAHTFEYIEMCTQSLYLILYLSGLFIRIVVLYYFSFHLCSVDRRKLFGVLLKIHEF